MKPRSPTSPARVPERRLLGLRAKAETGWDIVRRVWLQGAEDNVLFLAGGLAFNVLLALLPFVLLLVSGLSFLLGSETTQAANTVVALIDRLLPIGDRAGSALLRGIVADVLATRSTVTLYSAIGFAWFSTRLFGSLRSVLALIFDGSDRGIMAGKLFDFLATLVATVAVVCYVVISTYVDLATTRGLALLQETGVRMEAMGGVGYLVGRLTALTVIFMLFYAMYRGLPRHRPSTRTAAVGALTASILFEIARDLFVLIVARFDPSSLYTGSIAAIVAVVFWTYYGALLFLIGGEVAQAFDLRQRELAALNGSGKPRRSGTPSARNTPRPPPKPQRP